MYFDLMVTALVVNVLWIISDWFYWLILWVPIVYAYKAYNTMKNLAQMGGFGGGGPADPQSQGNPKRRRKRKRGNR